MAYQSLYRRYRPRHFGEVVGQQHVVTALRNAVREGRAGHAYLFSGPRGTGKTSIARILAKALNCTEGTDGEPCGHCESCLSMDVGASYDLHELDAASNNGVDAMRDLIAKAALGSPGRTKVYILDEVHMLSTAASNALLKTLEEPPPHVTFVLATTDPQRVLPTIRSRAQQFEFGLIPAPDLERHVRHVMADAGIDVDDEAVAYVLRKGGGSARDTLSALDQVAALGHVLSDGEPLDDLLEALVARSTGGALTALAGALQAGREPRVVGEQLLSRLRDAFLAVVGAPADHLPEDERTQAAEVGRRMGPAAVTRALEAIGEALVEMRQAPDPRVPLEVALVRVTRPELDTSLAALVERVATLERRLVTAATDPSATGPPSVEGSGSEASPPVAPPRSGPRAVDGGSVPGRSTPDDREPDPSPAETPVRATSATSSTAPDPVPAATAATPPPAVAATPSGSAPARAAPAGPSGAPPAAAPAAPSGSPSRPPSAPGATLGPAAEARRRLQDRTAQPPGRRPPPDPDRQDAGADVDAVNPAAPSGATVPPAPVPSPSPPGALPAAAPAGAAEAQAPEPAEAGGPADFPSVAELARAWSEQVFEGLGMPARARFRAGRFLGVEDGVAVFGLPNSIHRDRCEEKRPEVEAALAAHFGRKVPLRLVVDGTADPGLPGGSPGAAVASPASAASVPGAPVAGVGGDDDEEHLDLADVHALPDATDLASTVVDRLLQAFPGSQVLE